MSPRTPNAAASLALARAKKAAASQDKIIDSYVEDTLHCMACFIEAGYSETTAIELTDITLGRRDALPD